jgi:hypothetical protein
MQSPEELIGMRRIYKAALKKKQAQAAKRLSIENPTRFIEDVAGLSTRDLGDGNPFFDLDNPKSPYRVMDEFLERDTGNYKMMFAGRKTGKTYFVQQKLLRRIMMDRNLRLMIGGESSDNATERGEWIRGRLDDTEAHHGPFKTSSWKKGRYTVQRPTGMGGYPTVLCTGPEKGQTGGHPDLIWLDDAVGEAAFESIKKQEDTVKWVKEKLLFQFGPTTELWITGTMWPGSFHLYRWVYDDLEGKPKMEEIAPGVLYHEGNTFDILSFDSGYRRKKPVFACLPMEFLAKQFKINPMMSKCQYDNSMLDNQDVAFSAQMLNRQEIPEDTPVSLYCVTDMSGTKKGGRATSTSCIVVFALTPDDHCYVLYTRVGQFHPDVGPGIILDMLAQCKAERNRDVELMWFENTGPGALYPSLIRKECEIRGIEPPAINEIHRSTDTHQRILSFLLNPVRQNRLHFTSSVPPNHFDIDEQGEPIGEIAQDFLKYSYSAEGKPDILDAFADIWAMMKGGARMCLPPGQKEEEKVLPRMHSEEYFKRLRDDYNQIYGGSGNLVD